MFHFYVMATLILWDITIREEECTMGAVKRLVFCMNLPVNLNKLRYRESIVKLWTCVRFNMGLFVILMFVVHVMT